MVSVIFWGMEGEADMYSITSVETFRGKYGTIDRTILCKQCLCTTHTEFTQHGSPEHSFFALINACCRG